MRKNKRIAKKKAKRVESESLINRKVMNRIISDSNLCRHAMRELDLAGYGGGGNCPDSWMRDQVMEAVALFSSHGNSGMSAPWEINLVKKLCSFEILSPLTFEDDEWNAIDDEGTCQNRRSSGFFRDPDGSVYNIHAFSKKVVRTKRFGSDRIEENKDGVCWNGAVWLTRDGIATGEMVRRCCVPSDKIPYTPIDTIYLPCTEIEVAEDDWVMFTDTLSEEFSILERGYDVVKVTSPAMMGVEIDKLTKEVADEACEWLRRRS